MAEDLPSIIEFSEDIGEQEAPVPLPPGEYPATITGAIQKNSTNSGNNYAAVTFKISIDDYPPDYDVVNAPDGTTLTYNRIVTEDEVGPRYRMRRFLEAIRAPMGKRIDMSEWIGLEATVVVKNGEFEGVPRAEIDKVKGA